MIETKTLKYYEQNADDLMKQYIQADMNELHKVLLNYMKPKSNVIDIGFGIGRELVFLHNHKFNIWGVDPTEKFLNNIFQIFPDFKNHFFRSKLPDLNIPTHLNGSFDTVLCLAVWMHLEKTQYIDAIGCIKKLLKATGRVIITYSHGSRRKQDSRYFENIDAETLLELFALQGFKILYKDVSNDQLNRKELLWHTLIFELE